MAAKSCSQRLPWAVEVWRGDKLYKVGRRLKSVSFGLNECL